MVGRPHHGRTLQLPASARRKTLNFDSSYVRFDGWICVWVLHSIRPSTLQRSSSAGNARRAGSSGASRSSTRCGRWRRFGLRGRSWTTSSGGAGTPPAARRAFATLIGSVRAVPTGRAALRCFGCGDGAGTRWSSRWASANVTAYTEPRVKLHPDCHVQFENAYYSASFRLVRQGLWLRATETTVQLFRGHGLVVTHLRQFRPDSRCAIDEHLSPEGIAYNPRGPQWCLRQSEDFGAACHDLVERLFAHRVLDILRAAQNVIGLARRFGTVRLEAAWRRALTFDDQVPHCEDVNDRDGSARAGGCLGKL